MEKHFDGKVVLRSCARDGQRSLFELGKQIGMLIAELDFFESWIADMKTDIHVGNPYVKGESQACNVSPIIESLRENEIVVKCHYAESKLATISNIQCVLNGELEDQQQAFFDANLMIAEATLEQVRTA